MRVFAFGGTRYEVRARLGEWPDDFAGTAEFEDLSALPFGQAALAYGVGIRHEPALILRERQKEEDRGGYAYTVMLDPGRDTWQRFGWNGARLLLAVRADERLWHALLHEPQLLASSFLEERIGRLPADVNRPFGQPAGERVRLRAALMAGCLSPEVLSVGQGKLAVANRIDPALLAEVLDELPIAFRCGRGWLVGGRRGSEAKFGTALVIDHLTPDDSVSEAALAHAASALESLRLVSSSQLSPSLDALLRAPLHEWTHDVGRVAAHWTLLADLASGRDVDLEPLVDVQPTDLLADDVCRALMAQGESPRHRRYSAGVSDWLLARFGRPEAIRSAFVRRLDPQSLARYLNARELTLASPTLAHVLLSGKDAVAVWRMQLTLAPRDRVVALFSGAGSHLQLAGNRIDSELVNELFAGVSDRPADDRPSLRDWQTLGRDDALWAHVVTRLSALAREQVANGDEGTLDYLSCGDDLGAEWLMATHGIRGVDRVIGVAMSRVPDRHVGPEAHAWLNALALSPVRLHLPLTSKLQIARAVDDDWRRLIQLNDLVTGVDVVMSHGATTSLERDALVAELRGMVAECVQHQREVPELPISLEKIARLIGAPIPADVVADIVSVFPVNDATVDWLRRAGYSDAADAAIRHEWRELPRASAAAPAALITRILLDIRDGGDAVDQASAVADLLSRVDGATLETVLRENTEVLLPWLGLVLLNPSGRLEQAEIVMSRVSESARTMVLDVVAAARLQAFADLFGAVSASGRPALGGMLFSYISSREDVRDYVAGRCFGKGWSEASPEIAEGLLGAPADVEPDPERDEKQEPRGFRRLTRALKLLRPAAIDTPAPPPSPRPPKRPKRR